jgi:hypothetical protein
MFNQEHLTFFINAYTQDHADQQWVGHNPMTWASWIRDNGGDVDKIILESLPDRRINRQELLDLINDQKRSIELLALSILAWGGMNRNHGLALLASKAHWLQICNSIATGNICRDEAYRLFQSLREEGLLSGMGPAYFTKLIYFLHPCHNGYIMDQWTASSINILINQNLINVTNAHHVQDSNTPVIYEKFCCIIEDLAMEINERTGLNLGAAEVEERLFSVGGRQKHHWRQYVIHNRGIARVAPRIQNANIYLNPC